MARKKEASVATATTNSNGSAATEPRPEVSAALDATKAAQEAADALAAKEKAKEKEKADRVAELISRLRAAAATTTCDSLPSATKAVAKALGKKGWSPDPEKVTVKVPDVTGDIMTAKSAPVPSGRGIDALLISAAGAGVVTVRQDAPSGVVDEKGKEIKATFSGPADRESAVAALSARLGANAALLHLSTSIISREMRKEDADASRARTSS